MQSEKSKARQGKTHPPNKTRVVARQKKTPLKNTLKPLKNCSDGQRVLERLKIESSAAETSGQYIKKALSKQKREGLRGCTAKTQTGQGFSHSRHSWGHRSAEGLRQGSRHTRAALAHTPEPSTRTAATNNVCGTVSAVGACQEPTPRTSRRKQNRKKKRRRTQGCTRAGNASLN